MTLAGMSTRGIDFPMTAKSAGRIQLRGGLRLGREQRVGDKVAIAEPGATGSHHSAILSPQRVGRLA